MIVRPILADFKLVGLLKLVITRAMTQEIFARKYIKCVKNDLF